MFWDELKKVKVLVAASEEEELLEDKFVNSEASVVIFREACSSTKIKNKEIE